MPNRTSATGSAFNVQITGQQVNVLREWYEEHWKEGEDATPEILRIIERHAQPYEPL